MSKNFIAFSTEEAALDWVREQMVELAYKYDICEGRKSHFAEPDKLTMWGYGHLVGEGDDVWAKAEFAIEVRDTFILYRLVEFNALGINCMPVEEQIASIIEQATEEEVAAHTATTFGSKYEAMYWARKQAKALHAMMGTPYTRVEQRELAGAWQLRTFTGKRNNIDITLAFIDGVWSAHHLYVYMQN